MEKSKYIPLSELGKQFGIVRQSEEQAISKYWDQVGLCSFGLNNVEDGIFFGTKNLNEHHKKHFLEFGVKFAFDYKIKANEFAKKFKIKPPNDSIVFPSLNVTDNLDDNKITLYNLATNEFMVISEASVCNEGNKPFEFVTYHKFNLANPNKNEIEHLLHYLKYHHFLKSSKMINSKKLTKLSY